MDQPHLELTQGTGEVFISGFGGLAGQFFGLFDQGAYPVRLAAFGAGTAHALDHFDAPGVGDQHGVDRRTPRRQLVEDRGVEVGVGAHGQGAWDRRGGHDQLVRVHAPAHAFLAQGQALLHAKAVLFVNDHQRKVLELHFVLEQCMGAHHHRCAGGDLLQGGDAVLAFELASQPRHLQAQRFEPALEGDEVLFGENFRRCHQRHLIASFQGLQGGQGSDHGFACPYVTLDQPQHRFLLAEVVGDFIAHALLRAGGRKAEVGQVLRRQPRGSGHRRGAQGTHAFAQALLGQLVREQFFKGQAMLGPMMTEGEFVHIGIGGRVMQIPNRIGQGRQLIIAGQLQGQPIGQTLRAKHRQGLHAQLAQALLGQALGQRVDRRERGVHRWRLVAGNGAVFRVVDFQARCARACLAVAAHAGATLEAFLLRVAEVVEAQAQAAGTVLQAHHQAAALAHHHVGATDGAFDHRVLPRAQMADGHHAGAVLVAQGQVEQHVLKVLQADLGQLLGHGLTDTLECRHRHLRQLSHTVA